MSKPTNKRECEHGFVHDWRLIEIKPITTVRPGYVRNWGDDYPVTYQRGEKRRFYCSRCRETAEDVENFETEVRLTA